jgi:hypothetical protein
MSKNVTAPMQFSLGELMGTIALTFVGMALLGPLVEPLPMVVGAITAIFASGFGAVFVMRVYVSGPGRWIGLLIALPLSWIAAFSLVVLVRQPEFLLGAAIFSIPAFVGALIGWVRSGNRNLSGLAFAFFIGKHCVFSTVTVYGGLALILPPLLRTHCGSRCGTAAPAACKAYAEAQEIYHRTDYNGDGVLEYAQHMKGPRSLLMNDTTEIALIDRAFAAAEGADSERPKAGYLFKILYAQGPDAAGGALSYVDASGRMTKGYALIAWPAAYDSTGRDSYMISNRGTIYQSDLGPDTARIVVKMTEFNPTAPLWTPTE